MVLCRPRIVWVSDTRSSLSTRDKAGQFCVLGRELMSTVRITAQRLSSSMVLMLACVVRWLSVFSCLLFLSR